MGNFNRDNRSKPRRDFGQRNFGKRSFGSRGGEREKHKAVCSNCGKDCEVPFEPTGSKPVYCDECFKKIGGRVDSRRFQSRSPRRPDNEQLEVINRKLDKILEVLTVTPKITTIAKKKTKIPKKKTPVIKE